jgi:hypothetical protein
MQRSVIDIVGLGGDEVGLSNAKGGLNGFVGSQDFSEKTGALKRA